MTSCHKIHSSAKGPHDQACPFEVWWFCPQMLQQKSKSKRIRHYSSCKPSNQSFARPVKRVTWENQGKSWWHTPHVVWKLRKNIIMWLPQVASEQPTVAAFRQSSLQQHLDHMWSLAAQLVKCFGLGKSQAKTISKPSRSAQIHQLQVVLIVEVAEVTNIPHSFQTSNLL